MANTRFNYDKCRTNKLLQEATGPGRYMLNTPGPAHSLGANNDPHYRLQRWGGNLGHVLNGHPIDIDSDLIGLNKNLSKYDEKRVPSKSKAIIIENMNSKHKISQINHGLPTLLGCI